MKVHWGAATRVGGHVAQHDFADGPDHYRHRCTRWGRVELGLLKRMCTSVARLLLPMAVFSVGLGSAATRIDSASSLGLTESS
jgi:hypothetical protein